MVGGGRWGGYEWCVCVCRIAFSLGAAAAVFFVLKSLRALARSPLGDNDFISRENRAN